MKTPLRYLFTALLAAVSLCTAACAMSEAESEDIQSAVAQAINGYAAKVYKPNAADDAFDDFMIHGFFGSSTMKVTESSNVVSSLFNAELFKDALIQSAGRTIILMQERGEDTVFLRGGPNWHSYACSYSYAAYRGTEKDPVQNLNLSTNSKKLYGSSNYPGAINRNDQCMKFIAGSLSASYILRRVEETADTVVYEMALDIHDTFDFTTDYSEVKDKGFDTGRDQSLTNLGFLLQFVGLGTFDWQFLKTLRIEVPNYGKAAEGHFHWVYDLEQLDLQAQKGAGLTENTAEAVEYVNSKTGESSYYFRLDDTIALRHDKPWVVEMTMMPAKSLVLSPADTVSSSLWPYILQSARSYTWVSKSERILLTPEEQAALETTSSTRSKVHYYGREIKDLFKYSSKTPFTYRLENVLLPDGSNMPHISVYNHKLEQVVCGPMPLETYWTKNSGDTERTLVDEHCGALSGVDLLINYIGNKSYRLTHPELDIQIWTEGTPAESETLDGDINADGYVNARDVNLLRRDFGKQGGEILHPAADINADGFVNARDVNLLRRNFGKMV